MKYYLVNTKFHPDGDATTSTNILLHGLCSTDNNGVFVVTEANSQI